MSFSIQVSKEYSLRCIPVNPAEKVQVTLPVENQKKLCFFGFEQIIAVLKEENIFPFVLDDFFEWDIKSLWNFLSLVVKKDTLIKKTALEDKNSLYNKLNKFFDLIKKQTDCPFLKISTLLNVNLNSNKEADIYNFLINLHVSLVKYEIDLSSSRLSKWTNYQQEVIRNTLQTHYNKSNPPSLQFNLDDGKRNVILKKVHSLFKLTSIISLEMLQPIFYQFKANFYNLEESNRLLQQIRFFSKKNQALIQKIEREISLNSIFFDKNKASEAIIALYFKLQHPVNIGLNSIFQFYNETKENNLLNEDLLILTNKNFVEDSKFIFDFTKNKTLDKNDFPKLVLKLEEFCKSKNYPEQVFFYYRSLLKVFFTYFLSLFNAEHLALKEFWNDAQFDFSVKESLLCSKFFIHIDRNNTLKKKPSHEARIILDYLELVIMNIQKRLNDDLYNSVRDRILNMIDEYDANSKADAQFTNDFLLNLRNTCLKVEYDYSFHIARIIPLLNFAKKNISLPIEACKPVNYSWIEEIDKQIPTVIKNKKIESYIVPKEVISESVDDIPVESSEHLSIINESENHFSVDYFTTYVSALEVKKQISYNQCLLLDEQLHARHLSWFLDLVIRLDDREKSTIFINSHLINHTFHILEQFLTRHVDNPYLDHSLLKLTQKNIPILKEIEKGTFFIRYPHTCLAYSQDATPLGLKLLTTDLSIEKTLTLILTLIKLRIDWSTTSKEEDFKNYYHQICNKIESLLDHKTVPVNSKKGAADKNTETIIQITENIKNIFSPTIEKLTDNDIIRSIYDLFFHLENLKQGVSLFSKFKDQKYWSIFLRSFSYSSQYICEHLGRIHSHISQSFIRTHNLESYSKILSWDKFLNKNELKVIADINFFKSIEYFYGDINRHPLRNTEHLKTLDSMYLHSQNGNTAGEGFINHKQKTLNSNKIISDIISDFTFRLSVLEKIAKTIVKKFN
ncbi:MAG: hypothetical protein BGO10_01100 [Chlamydia sp. 32-24]|nr:MAG: hypothetical protein BGO10_01100 [Chlamydia sp. 32-24]